MEKVTLNEIGPRDWKFSHRANPGTDEIFNKGNGGKYNG